MIFEKLKEKPGAFSQHVKHETQFLRNWLDNPRKTGAIAPSGLALAKAMAGYVSRQGDLPILEIGPGTGAVTDAILAQGVAPDRLIAVEYSPNFCTILRDRFKGVNVIQGDGFAISETLYKALGVHQKFAAIVSSLPLLNNPKMTRQAFLQDVLEHMEVASPFIQFSYGLSAPIEPKQGVTVEKTQWIVRNIPPARVFVYRKCA